jgi:hypothetical protein
MVVVGVGRKKRERKTREAQLEREQQPELSKTQSYLSVPRKMTLASWPDKGGPGGGGSGPITSQTIAKPKEC